MVNRRLQLMSASMFGMAKTQRYGNILKTTCYYLHRIAATRIIFSKTQARRRWLRRVCKARARHLDADHGGRTTITEFHNVAPTHHGDQTNFNQQNPQMTAAMILSLRARIATMQSCITDFFTSGQPPDFNSEEVFIVQC